MTKAPAGVGAAPGTSIRSSSVGGSSTASPSKSKPQPSAAENGKPVPVPPDTPGVARIIAIANQKGGVGKSTTAVSLGASLADLGYRVLVIDLDPQGNASTGMGIRHEARDITVYDVIVAEASVGDAIVQTPVEHLSAIPSTIDLAGAEIELVSQFSRETRLKKALAGIREGVYDFILVDCPPSLGLLTINALTAAEELIVPIQCEYYALEGLGQLLRNVSLVQQNINPGLRLSGIVMTMFDPRTKLSEQVVEEVRRYFGPVVYDIIIPRTVRLSEAPGFGQPITVYDPRSKGAACYRELAREVALRPPPSEPMPVYEDLPTVVVPPIDSSPAPQVSPDEDELGDVPTVADLVKPEEAAAPTGTEPEPKPKAEPASGSEASASASSQVAEPSTGVLPVEQATTEISTSSVEQVGEDDDMWEEPEPESERHRVRPPSVPPPVGHLPERRVVVIDEDAERAAMPPRPGQGGDPEAEAEAPPAHSVAEIGATLSEVDGPRKRRWRLFRKGGE